MNGASGAMLCPSSLMREGEPRECGAYDALGMRRVCWNAVRGKAFGSPTEGGGDQRSGLRLKTLRGRMSAGTRSFSVVPEASGELDGGASVSGACHHEKDRSDNTEAGRKHDQADMFVAEQPAEEHADDGIYIFKRDGDFRPGIHEQPEITAIGHNAAEKHQSRESRPAFGRDFRKGNAFAQKEGRDQRLQTADEHEKRADPHDGELRFPRMDFGIKGADNPAQRSQQEKQRTPPGGQAGYPLIQTEQDDAEGSARQTDILEFARAGFMQKEPAADDHPDGHHSRKHAGYAGRHAFLPLAEKAAADKHHEEGKNETLPEVGKGRSASFAVQPGGKVQDCSGGTHAYAAEQKGRKAFQRELDADVAGTPRHIDQYQAGNGHKKLFPSGTQHGWDYARLLRENQAPDFLFSRDRRRARPQAASRGTMWRRGEPRD